MNANELNNKPLINKFPNKINKKLIYDKTGGMCIICGHHIDDDVSQWSVEHYIPRAIYKWLPNQQLETKLEQLENLFIVHLQCNFQKDSSLPNLQKINSMHASDTIKAEVRTLYNEIKESIFQYKSIKYDIWENQKQHCAFCNKKILFSQCTLRRKNNERPRSKENAMCLCFSCSVRAGNPQFKQRMVQKKRI